MPRVQVGDIGMYYEIEGAGAPVLLIGGLGADLSLLKAIITGLATRGHRIVAFDNRGAGRSDTPDVPYTIEIFAHHTLGLMDVLHLDRVDVIGISMGGRIAIELAARSPDRVDRLVLGRHLGQRDRPGSACRCR